MAKIEPANLLLKDKNGNIAIVKSLTDNDLNKLSVGLSDVSNLKTRVKAVEDNGYVSYNSVQTLNEEQCSQAQANMNAPGLSANNTFTGNMTVEANVKADSMTLNTSSDYAKLSASTNDHGIKLLGGSSDTTGASIDLRGSTDTDAPNTFTVSASNGVALTGSKDGSLTWNSENVVRKVNNLPADASGNVLLGTEKSTFNKVVYDTGYFSIGTNATYNFDLTGSDLENVSKENVNIRLVAKVTTAHNGFEVGDIAQLTTAVDHGYHGEDLDICSYIRGNTFYIYSGKNSSLSILSKTGWLEKADVQIKAVLTAFIPDDGSILLIAEDQTNTSKLIGLPDGTLTWGGKNIHTLKEEWHDDEGNFYRVYSDGWCEQGGRKVFTIKELKFVNLHKPMKNNNYIALKANGNGCGAGWNEGTGASDYSSRYYACGNLKTTSFEVYGSIDNPLDHISWYVCGMGA